MQTLVRHGLDGPPAAPSTIQIAKRPFSAKMERGVLAAMARKQMQ
jgi:hypothetical protein